MGSARVVVLVTVVLSGCGGASQDQLRTRAAFDLDCQPSQLQIVEIDDKTRGVVGCGGRNTYVEDCEREGAFGWRSGCTWILNVTHGGGGS